MLLQRKHVHYRVPSYFALYANDMNNSNNLVIILDEFKKDIDIGLDIWIKMFQYTELRAAMMAILDISDEIEIDNIVRVKYTYNVKYKNRILKVASYKNGKYGCETDTEIEYFYREELEKL